MDKRVDMPGDSDLPTNTPKASPWPSFSIVIPTYQRRDVVCEVVLALSRTNYPGKLELIIVVDGSTDGTAEALAAIACPFPVRIVEQPNGGASRARNRGATEAAHEVVLFLDDDMIAEPNLVEEHARFYREGADAVIGCVTIDPQSGPGFLPHSVARGLASSPVQSPLRPYDVFTGQLSVRRSIFEELGGFDPALTTGGAFGNEDADFGVRLLGRYDARYNPAAISRQRYVVTPREYMQRAAHAVAADLKFVRKHPELARQFFELKGASRPLARFVYRPLGLVPALPKLLSALAVGLAEAAAKTPFRSNRALARFFSGARATLYWSTLRTSGWPLTSRRVLVLCYHAVRDCRDDPVLAPYSVPPDVFVEQLDSLVNRGYSLISPGQFAAFLFGRAPVPKRAILLTFDDGYADLLELARNTLRERGISALVMAVSGFRTNEWDRASGAGTLELLDAEALRELALVGMEIGSHSHTHRLMTLLDAHELASETAGSADDLTARGVPRPRFFAYPYGACNAAAMNAVAEAGFLAAFGQRPARLRRSSPVNDLPRLEILSTDRGWRFRLKTAAPATYAFVGRKSDAISKRVSSASRLFFHGR